MALYSKYFRGTRAMLGPVLTTLQILTHFIFIAILGNGYRYCPNSTDERTEQEDEEACEELGREPGGAAGAVNQAQPPVLQPHPPTPAEGRPPFHPSLFLPDFLPFHEKLDICNYM